MESRSDLVFGRDISIVVKKKFISSFQDKKDWAFFTKNLDNLSIEDKEFKENYNYSKQTKKIDLHGYSLDGANKIIKKIIISCFNENYKKILVITGKGSRSQSYKNPYASQKLSILKNSVPAYIKSDYDLKSKVSKITSAPQKDGGDGAFYIFLRNKKN